MPRTISLLRMTDGANGSRERGKHSRFWFVSFEDLKQGKSCSNNGLHSGRSQRFITHDHGIAQILEFRGKVQRIDKLSKSIFTMTAEIHARSLANFYCEYVDRPMNLKFMRRVSEREPAIRQFVSVKKQIDVSF